MYISIGLYDEKVYWIMIEIVIFFQLLIFRIDFTCSNFNADLSFLKILIYVFLQQKSKKIFSYISINFLSRVVLVGSDHHRPKNGIKNFSKAMRIIKIFLKIWKIRLKNFCEAIFIWLYLIFHLLWHKTNLPIGMSTNLRQKEYLML